MIEGIKVGDKVRVSKDAPQFFRRYNSYRIFEVEHQVVDIEDGIALLDSIPSKYVTTIPCKYLVRVGEDRPKTKVSAIEIPVKLDYDESYWQNYEAQLAHDVAVKYAEQGTIDNPALADCVTALARKITESLKRK